MMAMTYSQTDEVLAGMFTEPTGASILDSGDAYGRQWQRNQGRDVASFMNAPEAWWDKYSGPVISTFHYLSKRLTFDPLLSRYLSMFAEQSGYERDPWLSIAEAFAEHLHDGDPRELFTGNSYNDETLLDGVFQWVQFTYRDRRLIALQIHGGCDVRGGYTKPQVFEVEDHWYWQVADCTIYCTAERDDDGQHLWEVRGPDVMSWDGSGSDELDDVYRIAFESGESPKCPRCGGVLAVDAPDYDPYW